jgi:hypothetical protein
VRLSEWRALRVGQGRAAAVAAEGMCSFPGRGGELLGGAFARRRPSRPRSVGWLCGSKRGGARSRARIVASALSRPKDAAGAAAATRSPTSGTTSRDAAIARDEARRVLQPTALHVPVSRPGRGMCRIARSTRIMEPFAPKPGFWPSGCPNPPKTGLGAVWTSKP